LEACNAIAHHQSYQINFGEWDLSIPPDEPGAAHQRNEHLLKVFSGGITKNLDVDRLGEFAVNILAQATKNDLGWEDFELFRDGQLSDPFIDHISSVVSRSRLRKIKMHTKKDEGRVRILKSIQWKHLHELAISITPQTFETSAMRELVEGVKKMSQKVEMERILFWNDAGLPLAMPEGDLLRDFLSSTSIRHLRLQVAIPYGQVLSLFGSIDFSRLETLVLWTKGFDSFKVSAILDGLRNATKLKRLHLVFADISCEHKERMAARGVTFSNWFS
jgi:hypothetical protein